MDQRPTFIERNRPLTRNKLPLHDRPRGKWLRRKQPSDQMYMKLSVSIVENKCSNWLPVAIYDCVNKRLRYIVLFLYSESNGIFLWKKTLNQLLHSFALTFFPSRNDIMLYFLILNPMRFFMAIFKSLFIYKNFTRFAHPYSLFSLARCSVVSHVFYSESNGIFFNFLWPLNIDVCLLIRTSLASFVHNKFFRSVVVT